MKNKTVQENSNVASMENLKTLAEIAKSNKFSYLLEEVQNAKKGLDSLFARVSQRRQRLFDKKEIEKANARQQESLVKDVTKVFAQKEDKSTSVSSEPIVLEKASQARQYPPRINKEGQNTSKQTPYQKPFDRTAKPFDRTAKPFDRTAKPFDRTAKPFDRTAKPFDRTAKPFDRGARPFDKKPTDFVKPAPVVEEAIIDTARNKFANTNTKPKQTDYDSKNKGYNKKQLIKKGFVESDDERPVLRKARTRKTKQEVAPIKIIENAVITTDNLTVKLLAESIGKPVAEIIKKLFLLGIMATINSVVEFETAELVASDLGVVLERKVEKTFEEKLTDIVEEVENEQDLIVRSPIVTVMGHVDHGKTSLLDAIRKTNVSEGEAGGITQHIGAYTVKTSKGKITFIDTPGHAAFTEMRARGAKVTDIAILVVAADDGIMPQTIEAINHIKAAQVPMIVAINKMDKTSANPDRVKQQLAEHEILAEEWGGDAILVPVSAHTKAGIDELLDMILLVAEVQELKANPNRAAMGTVIEANLDKSRGPIATIIVQNGTLKVGDTIVSGISSGRIRAMVDENGNELKEAGPSTPALVIGLDNVPQAGSFVNVVNEKMSKELVEERIVKLKEERQASTKPLSLEDLFSKVQTGGLKTLNLIIKAGAMGIVEALKQSLSKIKNEEVKVSCIHGGAGAINENDVLLAQTAEAIIIGFNVRPDANAKKLAEKEGIDIRFYNIIYDVIDDIEAAIKGMLAPKFKEVILGHAQIQALYKISRLGVVAGCLVKDGKILRSAKIRVMRDNVVIADTAIDTLRIQKDDVREVKSGFECGIKLVNFNDLKEEDILEAYTQEQIKI